MGGQGYLIPEMYVEILISRALEQTIGVLQAQGALGKVDLSGINFGLDDPYAVYMTVRECEGQLELTEFADEGADCCIPINTDEYGQFNIPAFTS